MLQKKSHAGWTSSSISPVYLRAQKGVPIGGSSPPTTLLEGHIALTESQNLTSIQSYLLSEESKYPGAKGDFTWVLSAISLSAKSKNYSLNEAYTSTFPSGYQNYLAWAHENGYSQRYVGTMVADVHRILMKGGVFMYPPTEKAPNGKLRLMYEANPMSMLSEQAGGKSFSGLKRTMEINPRELHERTSVILGSAGEVEKVQEFLQEE